MARHGDCPSGWRRAPRQATTRALASGLAVALTLSPGMATADEAGFVRAALRRHPALRALEGDVAAASAGAAAGRAAPPPTLRASVSNLGLPPHERPWLTLAIEQEWRLGGQREARTAMDRAGAAAMALGGFALRATIAAEARAAHLALRETALREALLERHLAHGALLAAALGRLAVAGRAGATTASLRLQADLAALRAEVAAVRARQPLLRAAARASLGLDDAAQLPPVDLGSVATPTATVEECAAIGAAAPLSATVAATLPANHPALLRAQAAIATAAAGVRAERAALAPTLRPGIGLMTMPGMPIGLMVSLGATVPRLPHLEAARRAQLRAARANVRAALARGDAARRAAAGSLAAAHGEHQANAARLDVLQREVLPLQLRVLSASRAEVAVGRASAVDLLLSQHGLWQLELAILDADAAVWRARAALIAVWVGGGPALGQPTDAAGDARGASGGDDAAMGGHP